MQRPAQKNKALGYRSQKKKGKSLLTHATGIEHSHECIAKRLRGIPCENLIGHACLNWCLFMPSSQNTPPEAREGEETFFTLDQIAERLQVSKESARRLFSSEPGVLRFNCAGKASTRNGRVRLRVPINVFNRVVNQMRYVD